MFVKTGFLFSLLLLSLALEDRNFVKAVEETPRFLEGQTCEDALATCKADGSRRLDNSPDTMVYWITNVFLDPPEGFVTNQGSASVDPAAFSKVLDDIQTKADQIFLEDYQNAEENQSFVSKINFRGQRQSLKWATAGLTLVGSARSLLQSGRKLQRRNQPDLSFLPNSLDEAVTMIREQVNGLISDLREINEDDEVGANLILLLVPLFIIVLIFTILKGIILFILGGSIYIIAGAIWLVFVFFINAGNFQMALAEAEDAEDQDNTFRLGIIGSANRLFQRRPFINGKDVDEINEEVDALMDNAGTGDLLSCQKQLLLCQAS